MSPVVQPDLCGEGKQRKREDKLRQMQIQTAETQCAEYLPSHGQVLMAPEDTGCYPHLGVSREGSQSRRAFSASHNIPINLVLPYSSHRNDRFHFTGKSRSIPSSKLVKGSPHCLACLDGCYRQDHCCLFPSHLAPPFPPSTWDTSFAAVLRASTPPHRPHQDP